MGFSPEQLKDYTQIYSSATTLLDELESVGFPYKRAREIRFSENQGGASWQGIDENWGIITIFTGCEPGAIAHELGHGFHERLRHRQNLPDQFGEDYAQAIRWFTEQVVGASSWCTAFYSQHRHRAVLDACFFKWPQFIARLKSGNYYPQ